MCVFLFLVVASRRVVIVSLSNPESCPESELRHKLNYFEFSLQITRNCFSSAKDFVFCAGTTVSLEAPWQAPEGFWEFWHEEPFPQHQQLWPPDNLLRPFRAAAIFLLKKSKPGSFASEPRAGIRSPSFRLLGPYREPSNKI